MSVRGSDVLMASYPKCGTSWLHNILFCLLHMDADGAFPAPLEQLPGSGGQAYPDAMPLQPEAKSNGMGGMRSVKAVHRCLAGWLVGG